MSKKNWVGLCNFCGAAPTGAHDQRCPFVFPEPEQGEAVREYEQGYSDQQIGIGEQSKHPSYILGREVAIEDGPLRDDE